MGEIYIYTRPALWEYCIQIIFSGLGGYFCYRVNRLLTEVKHGIWYGLLLGVACWIATNMIMLVGDWDNLPLTLLAFMAANLFCCGGSLWNRIGAGLIVCTEAFAFSTLIDTFLDMTLITGHLIRFSFWFFLWLLMKRRMTLGNQRLGDETWKVISLFMVLPMSMVICIVLLGRRFDRATLDSFVLLVLAVSSLFILMQMIPTLIAKERLMEEKRLYTINQTYYKNLERQQTEIRILRHDMIHHLTLLGTLPEKERQAYIEQLTGKLNDEQMIHYCDHPVVNGVLSVKSSVIRSCNIRFTVGVKISHILALEDVELCTLVGNSLDNAIEACEKVSVENRLIHFTMRAEKGMLVMRVENKVAEETESKNWKEGNLPQTTKKTSEGHGYGLRSIEQIIEKYDGQMELSITDGIFTLFLYLPLPDLTD
ncbi:MAG: GHKL domain-containing protein [Firmicutes bacterium]|nr:GHKL domain-containing protein [Bacillota bacterium]